MFNVYYIFNTFRTRVSTFSFWTGPTNYVADPGLGAMWRLDAAELFHHSLLECPMHRNGFVEGHREEGCFGAHGGRHTLIAIVGNTLRLRLTGSELLLEGPFGKQGRRQIPQLLGQPHVYHTLSCAFWSNLKDFLQGNLSNVNSGPKNFPD